MGHPGQVLIVSFRKARKDGLSAQLIGSRSPRQIAKDRGGEQAIARQVARRNCPRYACCRATGCEQIGKGRSVFAFDAATCMDRNPPLGMKQRACHLDGVVRRLAGLLGSKLTAVTIAAARSILVSPPHSIRQQDLRLERRSSAPSVQQYRSQEPRRHVPRRGNPQTVLPRMLFARRKDPTRIHPAVSRPRRPAPSSQVSRHRSGGRRD